MEFTTKCSPESENTCTDKIELRQCMSACYCKEGYVRQGQECIEEEKCGCTMDDNQFMDVSFEFQISQNLTLDRTLFMYPY